MNVAPDSLEHWVAQILAGDPRAISRAVTLIENREPRAEDLLKALFPHTGRALRIGITGSPGTGKSTLVDRLAAHYRAAGKTVGIIAVDPSSPFTGGAILGDRIRMLRHAQDEGTFIRSMATRGYLGGLAQATGDVSLLLDAAGKDVILIETVGVGQGEIEVVRVADCTLVVLTPGMGDDVQNLKAGLMEIGDIFVINKSDREGADQFEQQLLAVLGLVSDHEGWTPAIVRTIATQDQGTDDLIAQIARFRQHLESDREHCSRERDYWREWLLRLLQTRIAEKALGKGIGEAEFNRLASDVAARKIDPYSAADQILARTGLS
ncbi:MAG TPA: methylmalonyl Co-A mutase-associated GTPase MeaB [Candidatus Dormibacteraeota bacterium]|nr:methylmalonyl Co-A mutase-associated GTPase MeaB [Candidatus Dormibacteraeota bacterium]